MNEESSKKQRFQEIYEGQAPWDIGKPQKALVAIADRIHGSLLDAGCGTGENALFFAERGHAVMGIDFLEEPIARAETKAAERGLDLRLRVMDATKLGSLNELFDNVIDCGLFHVFSDEDRRKYIGELAHVVKPGGRLWLMCFSDKEPPGHGPRRISKQEIQDAFARDWEVESIDDSRFETAPDSEELFADDGPRAYLAVIRHAR